MPDLAAPNYSIHEWMEDARWYVQTITGCDVGIARYLKMQDHFIDRYDCAREVDFRLPRFALAMQFLQKHIHTFAGRGIAFPIDGKTSTLPTPIMTALWSAFANREPLFILEAQPPDPQEILTAMEALCESAQDGCALFDESGHGLPPQSEGAL
jgi:hypothetical protein